jgi:hypothetical protein
MALAGTGAILIWNDITPEGRAEFYAWHLNEHMPERLAIPGFLRGRRYIALDAATAPEFFTLYETADPGVTTSKPYLERLDNPTAWTRKATTGFRQTARALTKVVATQGPGSGGAIVTVRFGDEAGGRAALAEAGRKAAALAEVARLPRICGVHFCATDLSGSAIKTAESRHRTDAIPPPIGAILVEACDIAAARAGAQDAIRRLGLDAAGLVVGSYGLEHVRLKTDAAPG